MTLKRFTPAEYHLAELGFLSEDDRVGANP